MELYVIPHCKYCYKTILQAALLGEKCELKVIDATEMIPSLYLDHNLQHFVPILKKDDGSFMQESEDIINYLRNLPGSRLPAKPAMPEDDVVYLQCQLFARLRFACQYYFKLYYANSIIANSDVDNIAPFPGSEKNGIQLVCDELENRIESRFVNGSTLPCITSDDFDIFPDLMLPYILSKYCGFKFGPRTMKYMEEIIKLCSGVKGFKVDLYLKDAMLSYLARMSEKKSV